MIRFWLLLILTVMFCTITYGQEDDCRDGCFDCLVDFKIDVSHGGQFCGRSNESLTEQIQFQYRTIHGNWQFLESYNRNEIVNEHRVRVSGTSDTRLQFRWIQNNTLESPAWAIDDIVIFCSDHCQKDISFEETSETLETSLLECHSGVIHQGAASCSLTENSLLMNGTEREVRTTPFSVNNCRNNVNKRFFNTCKECEMEVLFNTTWPAIYIDTELTSPCVISERNITRTCDASGAWIPSPIDTYKRCARNNTVCLGPSLSHGLVWSTTLVNETVRMQCSGISELFWSGLNATRKCLDGGVWGEVDMSQCTMKTDKSSLITYSTHLNMSDGNFRNGSQIATELQRLLEAVHSTVSYEITMKNSWDSGAIFIMKLTNNLSLVQNISDSIDRNFKKFHKKNFIPSELVKMIPDGVCHCNSVVSVSGEAYFRVLETNACVGSLHPPCVYDGDKISRKCNRPYYTGNNTLCGQDTDHDGMPDVNLGCDGTSCQQDPCPWIYDLDNQNSCNAGTNGCEMERDKYFGIVWPWAKRNYTVQRVCPDGTGNTSRYCNQLGQWDDVPPDVRSCHSFVYQDLELKLSQIINSITDGLSPESVNRVLNILADLVISSNYSIFPLDIRTIHFVISKILNVAEEAPWLLEEEGFDNTFVGIVSDILDLKNEPGYEQLTDVNRTVNQMLILNSEKLGILLANSTDTKKTFVKENIVLSIERRNASSNIGPIMFPLQDLPDKYNKTEIDVTNNSIFIPASVIQQRAKSYADNILPIANIIYFSLERFLPRTENLSNPDSNTHVPVSVVISSQVGHTSPPVSRDDPIILQFQYTAGPNSNNTRCAFWNFDLMQNGGDGGWDITNVNVAYSNSTYIRCNSTHLTCFAVLVDIHGGVSDIKKEEAIALSVVSYFGCGISVICLLGAISLMIVYRRTLLKELHNFAHLNLAVALLLALTVFAVGIETATKNKIACTVVAALLHYLFTAVFSWMLCEGILLYVLLVKVFSTGLVKKKRLYFLLGWGIPLPIVGISVGIAHNDYGTDEFCWISFDKDVVWGFVGPMLLIIVINTIFLIMALRVLLKTKSHNRTTEEIKRRDIVKSMIKATVLLLPLLGLTWIFGLLTVNKHLTVFAWLFTVLNSLQGLFLFIFHVIRNEKVRNKIKNTAVFKAMKYLISVKDRVSYTKYKTGTSIKLNADFGNGTMKPSSAEKEDGSNQVEPIKTSSSPQSSELQQQTNSSDGILCTAV